MAESDLNQQLMAEQNEKSLNVYPIKKGKRMLLFLADFFITFIFSVFLFSFASYPIAQKIIGFEAISNTIAYDRSAETTLLYDNGIILCETSPGELSNDQAYTQKQFAVSLMGGTTAKNVFYHYYVEICGKNISELNDVYRAKDAQGFLDDTVDANGQLMLKDTYRKKFAPLLSATDSLSSAAQEDYDRFSTTFFMPLFSQMVTAIRDGSMLPGDSPLKASHDLHEESTMLSRKLDNTLVWTAVLTYSLLILVFYLLVPMISRRGRTVAQMLLRDVTVAKEDLKVLSRPARLLRVPYYLIANLPMLFFLPMFYVAFSYLFRYAFLLTFSLLGLLYVIVSFFVTLFTDYQQTLTDLLSHALVLKAESYDELEKTRIENTANDKRNARHRL